MPAPVTDRRHEPLFLPPVRLPRMARIRQHFEGPTVKDIDAAVRAEVLKPGLLAGLKKGQSVAVTGGSRGITAIADILRAVVAALKEAGAVPFLVPAMGSHGGGTAEGQIEVLRKYGITAGHCGCPIRASMETVVLGTTEDGVPVHFDRHAHGADHVFVVGRIKPHTDFDGAVESGLLKMMMIGLGKHEGAKVAHRAVQDLGFDRIVRTWGRLVLARAPILAGLGVIENARDKTAKVEAVRAADFETREAELLTLAKSWMPRLPLDHVDLLIVDEIGKNISGAGMDTNIINRKPTLALPVPVIKKIFLRDITPLSYGNASGIGLADITTDRMVSKVDWRVTLINSATSGWLKSASRPPTQPDDRSALDVVLRTIGMVEPPAAKVVRIRNTLHLYVCEVSEACLPELAGRRDIEVLSPPAEMRFDADGFLSHVPLEDGH